MSGSGTMSRRRFVQACGLGAPALNALVSGCSSMFTPVEPSITEPLACPAPRDGETFDYVVVDSGAGGGPLAANGARAGFRVLLLEAGGEDEPYEYTVPAFHARASEDPRLAWNFFVRHYADDTQQKRDD